MISYCLFCYLLFLLFQRTYLPRFWCCALFSLLSVLFILVISVFFIFPLWPQHQSRPFPSHHQYLNQVAKNTRKIVGNFRCTQTLSRSTYMCECVCDRWLQQSPATKTATCSGVVTLLLHGSPHKHSHPYINSSYSTKTIDTNSLRSHPAASTANTISGKPPSASICTPVYRRCLQTPTSPT